jgi:Zn finger protein HypA/HybF involved in hydrogenase expression
MSNITSIEKNLPHRVSEVICIKCYKRWISVRPATTKLIELYCPNCGINGVVIESGEVIE